MIDKLVYGEGWKGKLETWTQRRSVPRDGLSLSTTQMVSAANIRAAVTKISTAATRSYNPPDITSKDKRNASSLPLQSASQSQERRCLSVIQIREGGGGGRGHRKDRMPLLTTPATSNHQSALPLQNRPTLPPHQSVSQNQERHRIFSSIEGEGENAGGAGRHLLVPATCNHLCSPWP